VGIHLFWDPAVPGWYPAKVAYRAGVVARATARVGIDHNIDKQKRQIYIFPPKLVSGLVNDPTKIVKRDQIEQFHRFSYFGVFLVTQPCTIRLCTLESEFCHMWQSF
jgi:hypothetical protein